MGIQGMENLLNSKTLSASLLLLITSLLTGCYTCYYAPAQTELFWMPTLANQYATL